MATALIRDLAALAELRTSITRFCANAQLVDDVDTITARRLESLTRAELPLQDRIARCRQALRQAEVGLASRERARSDAANDLEAQDGLHYEHAVVEQCSDALDDAMHDLATWRRHMEKVSDTLTSYRYSRLKFSEVMRINVEVATPALDQLIGGAQDYLAATVPVGDSGAAAVRDSSTARVEPAPGADASGAEFQSWQWLQGVTVRGATGREYAGSVSKTGPDAIELQLQPGDGGAPLRAKLALGRGAGGALAGRILGIHIPPEAAPDKLGTAVFQRLETLCRLNGCAKITGWADEASIAFHERMGWSRHKVIPGAGAEMEKQLDATFHERQSALAQAAAMRTRYTLASTPPEIITVSPLDVLMTEDTQTPGFWSRRSSDMSIDQYIDLLRKFTECEALLDKGLSHEQVQAMDPSLVNAWRVCAKSQPILLERLGDGYKVDQGQHRVAAAQIHYLLTGSVIPLRVQIGASWSAP